jgi:hypothetical protein
LSEEEFKHEKINNRADDIPEDVIKGNVKQRKTVRKKIARG